MGFERSLWGWGGSYGAAVRPGGSSMGLGRDLWGWEGSMGLEGLWGSKGRCGAGEGVMGRLWGWGGFYGAGGDSTVMGGEAHGSLWVDLMA